MEKEENILLDKHLPTFSMIKRSFGYIKPEIKTFILTFVFIIFNVVLNVALPLFIGEITKNLKSDQINLEYIIFLVVVYFILNFLNQVFLYFETMILQKAGQRIIYKLRMEVYEHVLELSSNQLNHMPVGSLVTRVANYTTSVSDLFTSVFVKMITNILTIVGVFGVMLYISPLLSAILLIIIVIVFVLSYIFERIIKKVFKKERNSISRLNTFLSENISGMKIIQAFNKEKDKKAEFDFYNKELKKNRVAVTKVFALYRPLMNFLFYLAIASTFMFGVILGLSSSEIVSFYFLLSRFFNPVQELADKLNDLQRSLTALEKLFVLLDINPEVLDEEDAIEIDHFEGKIEFRNVYFAYENDDYILKNVSFIVNPKESVAFVGATGAGKTTILSLIVRNYEINSGEILIDDINIKHIKIKSLRKAIGQMLQDVFLFSGTIKENITLNDESFSDEEIKKVADYVNASYFIEKLPKKYEEVVIERGENFSSGERQLLSFARTVLAKPQILILDEATANIDTETESIIQQSLEKIKSIGTMLIVAHRLSTIQHCDKIFVLQDGKIIESGSHQDLLKNKGYYYKLYELQFSNN
ncbi:MAG: ABC transporter ATP-binding protein [Candidatus Onthovivens sp.]|nr:ABC transporter ATP-binding protein [Candidatus Onthovivens sp.]